MGEGHHTHTSAASHAQKRALRLSLILNAGFMIVEVAGGIAFNSLALLADAAHMASDVGGLAIAMVAQSLTGRSPTARHSYGLKRAEVLGALTNGLLLVGVSAWIVYEAIGRLGEPGDVAGWGLLVVATAGLAVNLVSAQLLHRAAGASLNMRGAFLHMMADAAGSVGAIAAGIAIVVWGATWVDSVASMLVALLVLWATWGLLRDAAAVLLEGTPRGLDPDAVVATLAHVDGVSAVHHLHIWSLSSEEPALSAHVVLNGELTLHEAQQRGDQLKAVLATEHQIHHATLELECHPCQDPTDDLGGVHQHRS
jgi:cobalt-zinc-cadmium efflux system protein